MMDTQLATIRLARLATEFALAESDELLRWLGHISGSPAEEMEPDVSWRFRAPDGIVVGIARGIDPICTAVSAATVLCGPYWPFVLPGLLKETKRWWKEIGKGRHAERKAGAQSRLPLGEAAGAP